MAEPAEGELLEEARIARGHQPGRERAHPCQHAARREHPPLVAAALLGAVVEREQPLHSADEHRHGEEGREQDTAQLVVCERVEQKGVRERVRQDRLQEQRERRDHHHRQRLMGKRGEHRPECHLPGQAAPHAFAPPCAPLAAGEQGACEGARALQRDA